MASSTGDVGAVLRPQGPAFGQHPQWVLKRRWRHEGLGLGATRRPRHELGHEEKTQNPELQGRVTASAADQALERQGPRPLTHDSLLVRVRPPFWVRLPAARSDLESSSGSHTVRRTLTALLTGDSLFASDHRCSRRGLFPFLVQAKRPAATVAEKSPQVTMRPKQMGCRAWHPGSPGPARGPWWVLLARHGPSGSASSRGLLTHPPRGGHLGRGMCPHQAGAHHEVAMSPCQSR